jgi:hypothetical protein
VTTKEDLILFEDGCGVAVYLPREHVSHWTLSKGGALTVYAGGQALHPTDAAAVLAQLVPPLEEQPLEPVPAPVSRKQRGSKA